MAEATVGGGRGYREGMKVGVTLPIGETDGADGRSPTFAEIAAFASAAEDGGLDSGWVADHLFYRAKDGREFGLHDGWTVLTGIAATKQRIELGTLVLCTSFRNAVQTAKLAAAFDVVSDGRLILGLGCGWHGPEYEAMGVPFEGRVSNFDESLQVIRRLLDGERVTFHGEHVHADDAVLLPAPARRIPILVAASKPRMLRLAGRHADAWNAAWYGVPDEELRQELANLDEAMTAVGRPTADVERTVGLVIRDREQPPPPKPEKRAFDGTIEELADLLRSHRDLGFGHAIVGLEPMTIRSVERLAQATRLAGVQAR
jgi:alkanesulfonate monooxygenase SsuD/methylene tetrahydromethanopterin reductase-like flavin-dependent oxidoreductase (luciferase family)